MDETSVCRLGCHLSELRVGTRTTQPLDINSGKDLVGRAGVGMLGNRNLLIT